MVLISLIISGVNIFGIWFLSEFLDLYYILSKIVTSLFTFGTKFLLRKKVLF